MMNSRSYQPADLPSLPNLLAEVLDVIQEDFTHLSGFLIRKKRGWGWGWGWGSWRSMALSHVNPHYFVAFSNSARFHMKASNISGYQSSILLLPLTSLLFAKGRTICRKLHAWHHTHPKNNRFSNTSCIYLPTGCHVSKNMLVKKPGANQMPMQGAPGSLLYPSTNHGFFIGFAGEKNYLTTAQAWDPPWIEFVSILNLLLKNHGPPSETNMYEWCIFTYGCTYLDICIYIYVHIYIYIWIHIYIYIYICLWSCNQPNSLKLKRKALHFAFWWHLIAFATHLN